LEAKEYREKTCEGTCKRLLRIIVVPAQYGKVVRIKCPVCKCVQEFEIGPTRLATLLLEHRRLMNRIADEVFKTGSSVLDSLLPKL
jgi:phage FluMu protein Com